MMGLVPYGKSIYKKFIKDHIVEIQDDGNFFINQRFFDGFSKRNIFNQDFEELFGQPRRAENSEIEPFYADIAASIQTVVEEILTKTVGFHSKRV